MSQGSEISQDLDAALDFSPAHTVVVLNPNAGGGRAETIWKGLLHAVPELEAATVIQSTHFTAARQRLTHAFVQGEDVRRVVVVGGDGTVQTAVECILRSDTRPLLGIVPAGTGCDLARSLNLPQRPVDALRLALGTQYRRVDAMAVDTGREKRICVNIASAGLSGVVARANANRGSSRYLTAALSSLTSYRAPLCRLETDEECLLSGPLLLVAVANGRFFGKGLPIAPEASLDDGLLDVVVVPRLPLPKVAVLILRLLAAKHLSHPLVTWRRARRVHLSPLAATESLACEIDGEALEGESLTLEVLPRCLSILAPSA